MSRAKKKEQDDFSDSILSKLIEEHGQKSAEDEFANDVTILFCGSKKSGKTSLVDRFINPSKDDKDQPKPTVALDYKFARYATEGSTSKVLAHIYDLGGDEGNENQVGVPVCAGSIGNLVLAITLDLSEPHTCMQNLDKWLKLLRAQVDKAVQALGQENPAAARRVEALQALRSSSYGDHPDRGVINPFPVPLVIFGTKADVLNADVDPDKRKNLLRAIRHFALANGAFLLTCSLKEKTSLNNMRTVLRQLLFQVAPKGGFPENTDPSKPLSVEAGKDSVQSIGMPPGGTASERAWRDLIENIFPDSAPMMKGGKKSESDQVNEELLKYPESSIDGMVEQRIEELQQYRKQVERNQRLASEGVHGVKEVLAAA